jgi:hypothetical protein
MAYYPLFQYQNFTEPLSPIVKSDEAAFHEPWSDPVRFRIIPALVVALLASGLFAPPMQTSLTGGNSAVNEAMQHAPWSEPVRFKPSLSTSLQLAFVQGDLEIISPQTFIDGWFVFLAEPVKTKPGLLTDLQQALAAPSRLIPPPSVTVTVSVIETDTDAASGAINVLQSPAAGTGSGPGSVSVVED